jgi:hypothetical protein
LASRSPGAAIVLKNPWDVGRESQILADFPEAVIILVRRRVADIERSLAHALQRSSSSAYARALEPDTDGHRRYQQQLRSPVRRELLLQAYRMALRRRIYRLTKSVPALPIDRVALVSYDEFLSDPIAAAGWVGHIVDPPALALAFTRRAFSAPTRSAPSSALQRTLDRRWKTSWDLARSAQARAGILPAPWAVTDRRTRRRSLGSSRYRPITSTRATSHEPPRLTVSSEEAPS